MTTKNRSIESDAAKDAASAAYDREVAAAANRQADYDASDKCLAALGGVAAAAKRQADYESLVFNMGIVKAAPPAPPPCVGQGKDRQGAR
jgi:hypothetical protein